MSAPTRILFLTQWFEPEPAFKGLSFVKALRARGLDVDVVTGFPNYPGGKLYPGYGLRPWRREVLDGIRILRLPLYPSHDRSGIRRGLNYLSFFLTATLYLLLRWRRYDAIYVYHPPITVGLAAAVSGLVRPVPFVIEIQDLWPDSVTASGMAGARVARALNVACRFVYRRATSIVAQSRGMAQMLIARGMDAKKVQTIFNWAEEELVQPRGTLDLSPYALDGFTFVYGGNVGAHQALKAVVEAAILAHARNPTIRVLIVGQGVDWQSVHDLAQARAPGIVQVMPMVSRDAVADVFARADVLLVHLADRPLYAFTVPSKTQFYLASAKPILAGLTGEAADMITQAGAGLVVPPENVVGLADAMVELAGMEPLVLARMGDSGRRYYDENLSYDRAIDATTSVIKGVARS